MSLDLSSRIQQLIDERARHAEALQLIDNTLTQITRLLGGNAMSMPKRGRPPKSAENTAELSLNSHPKTLADHLEAVIKHGGKPLGIADLIAGVKTSGHRSKAADIRPIVSLALIKDTRFRRVARGVYALA